MNSGNGDPRIQQLEVEVAVLNTRLNSKEEALELQAKEYERRLHDLNDAHRVARDTLATFTPRELFERGNQETRSRLELSLKEVEIWRRTVDKYMANNTGRNSMLTAIIAFLLAIASIVVTLMLRFHL